MKEYKLIQGDVPKLIQVREFPNAVFNNSDSVIKFMQEHLQLHLAAEEYVYVIALNTKNRALGIFEVSHGTVDAAYWQPREILIRALLCGASRILLIHNHPSQIAEPSKADTESAERLRETCNLVGLDFLDSIIVTAPT